MNKLRYTILALAAAATMPTAAKLTLPAYLASHMVLQQKSVMTFKGTATPNSHVRIYTSWNKENVTDSVDGDGNFAIKVSIPEASKTSYFIRVTELKTRANGSFISSDIKVLSDVLVGEVWLCTGQSNMEMPVQGWGKVNNYAEEVKNANYPYIRLFQVAEVCDNHPSEEVPVSIAWTACSPTSVPEFSAAGYFFGRELYNNLDIPIGLVQSARGGSIAETWLSIDKLKTIKAAWSRYSAGEKYDFDIDSVRINLGWTPDFTVPSVYYNKMIYPLRKFPIRGAIWYQGEGNAWGSSYYTALMDTLISSWRQDWGYNFPFYAVQLAGYNQQVDVQPNSKWAALRWDQQKTALQMDSTGLATAVDIGNQTDIHPKNKQEVGRRLALLALKKTYGQDVVAEAPIPIRYQIGYKKTTIVFSGKIHARNDSVPVGFIYGSRSSTDTYKVATAEIVNDTTIEITPPSIMPRGAVRYNWADYPIGNIYGENGLPVLPFRTDDTATMRLVGIDGVELGGPAAKASRDIYTIDGALVRRNASDSDVARLKKGIYIMGGEKIVVR